MYPNRGMFDYSKWMRPSVARSPAKKWWGGLAWVGIGALAYGVYVGLDWLWRALGGVMQ